MTLNAASWLVIVLALVLANLPFVVERPIAAWPWVHPVSRTAPRRWLATVIFVAGLAAWCWGTVAWVGGAFAGGGGTVGLFAAKLAVSAVLAAVLLAVPAWLLGASDVPAEADSAAVPAAARMAARTGPGAPLPLSEPNAPDAPAAARASSAEAGAARRKAMLAAHAERRKTAEKSFFDRLLEVLVGYVLVGSIGYALELNLGNAFPLDWEFYAITLALFLVLAYPGFVFRYLLRRRRR